MQKIRMMCVTPDSGYQKRISRIVLASCGVPPLPRIKYGANWDKKNSGREIHNQSLTFIPGSAPGILYYILIHRCIFSCIKLNSNQCLEKHHAHTIIHFFTSGFSCLLHHNSFTRCIYSICYDKIFLEI